MSAVYLLNNDKEVIRSIKMTGALAQVIYREDSKRIELTESVEALKKKKVKFKSLAQISLQDLNAAGEVKIPSVGVLSLAPHMQMLQDVQVQKVNESRWYQILALVLIGGLGFIQGVRMIPKDEAPVAKIVEIPVVPEIVAKIEKKPVEPKPERQLVTTTSGTNPQIYPTGVKSQSISRMGALAVLGNAGKGGGKGSGSMLGGLSMAAIGGTSAGPGLGGGTGGSGGVQTSLYGKGIIGAPIGGGNNPFGEGGTGGPGTRGKGGGQAGYGQMTLIGSVGTSAIPTGTGGNGGAFGTASIPLGKDAIIDGGLDQEMIDGVVKRNMAQVRFCYEQGLQLDPKLAGRVAVNFTIGKNGNVTAAGLNNSTLQSQTVEDCILLRLRTWKFPIPSGEKEVKVSYPFVLRRLGAG